MRYLLDPNIEDVYFTEIVKQLRHAWRVIPDTILQRLKCLGYKPMSDTCNFLVHQLAEIAAKEGLSSEDIEKLISDAKARVKSGKAIERPKAIERTDFSKRKEKFTGDEILGCLSESASKVYNQIAPGAIKVTSKLLTQEGSTFSKRF